MPKPTLDQLYQNLWEWDPGAPRICNFNTHPRKPDFYLGNCTKALKIWHLQNSDLKGNFILGPDYDFNRGPKKKNSTSCSLV